MLVNMQEFDNYDERMNSLDYLPGKLRFMKYSEPNNSIWAPLLEKAFMKVRGNYQSNEGGSESNALRILTGAPISQYKLMNTT